mmetsp:Transcript_118044/g.341289  ORF Transcript_118044/g.341289 Transcript_118044/m.341289 type:complete len:218 (+) Transcript_118044:472-1125(+)
MLEPMYQRHDRATVLLDELGLFHQDLLAVVRDEDREPREVGAAIWPGHRQTEATAQGREPPTHVCVRRLVGIRHAAVCLQARLRRVLAAEGGRHLHTEAGAARLALCGDLLVERLLEILEDNPVPGALDVEGQVCHSAGVDVVLVAHVGDDPIPDEGEVGGEVRHGLTGLLLGELRVVQHLLGKALGQPRHGVFVDDVGSGPTPLLEHGEYAKERAP